MFGCLARFRQGFFAYGFTVDDAALLPDEEQTRLDRSRGDAFNSTGPSTQAVAYGRTPLPAALDLRAQRACFIVKDRRGQALAYVYYEDEPGRRSAANLLTCDEARLYRWNTVRFPFRNKCDFTGGSARPRGYEIGNREQGGPRAASPQRCAQLHALANTNSSLSLRPPWCLKFAG